VRSARDPSGLKSFQDDALCGGLVRTEPLPFPAAQHDQYRSQLTVKTRVLLVPPLEQPTSVVLPPGVCTATLKAPAAGIMAEVMVAVIWELLFTAVATTTPLKTITEEATNWLPVPVRTKLGGNCEKIMVVGEIELRTGAGRALPQSGFSALHPGRSKSAIRSELRRPIGKRDFTSRSYRFGVEGDTRPFKLVVVAAGDAIIGTDFIGPGLPHRLKPGSKTSRHRLLAGSGFEARA
jgi:hypothetical protein